MTLSSGSRLGPYEILSPIGAGGMGEVYKARDTRLGRTVALKLLPAELARDQSREARFEREARSASALSHANVVAVYDVGREGESLYLVTELVEGGNLRDLLDRGPVSLKRALEIAAQISAGLAAAHEQGIVHRDLKPENVLLTKAGEAKIADFGLAKLAGPDTDADSRLPTSDGLRTSDGMILGTVAYMSPEQASGRSVDFRSDQFSLGAVLYELLTEHSPFRRASAPETLAAILRDEPEPLGKFNPSAPPHVSWILERCLAREPEQRYASTRDLARELALVREHLSDLSSGASFPGVVPARRSRRASLISWVIAGSAVLGLLVLAARGIGRRSGPESGPVVRFSIAPPAGTGFLTSLDRVSMALSPDGTRLAFVARPSGKPGQTNAGIAPARQIWVRRLSELEPLPLAGTDGATSLFWSPDGKEIGFFAGDQLKRVDANGGSSAPICDIPSGSGMAGTWGSGVIVFASTFSGVIFRASPDGGSAAVPLISTDTTKEEPRACWPWFLPGGKSFLYVVVQNSGQGELRVASLDGRSRAVAMVNSRVEFMEPDRLVFARDGALFAQHFDSRAAKLTGPLIPLAPAVHYFYSNKWAHFATSRNGTVAYSSAQDISHLAWFDRSGRDLGNTGSPNAGNIQAVALSPDGGSALFDRTRLDLGTYDIWRIDLARGIETLVTSDPNTEFDPIWVPGGRQIIYSIAGRTLPRLVRRDLSSGREETLLPPGTFQEAMAVTPDGSTLIFAQSDSGPFGLWTISLDGDGTPKPLVVSRSGQEIARLAPDGRLLAFISNESGQLEAYVMPVGLPGEKIRLSDGGVTQLAWSRDGEKVYYTSRDGKLFVVRILATPRLRAEAPEPLFSLPAPGWVAFDVAPDGRFLAAVQNVSDAASPVSVVVNWTSELSR